ncbi:MAG: pirin family protein, partial [Flavobacteriales bacterium]|nr:pirin family protein [Flavobacteriales bacterium]
NTYPGGQHQSAVGVGPHPHRGFAPVTFIFKGGVHHRDSTGFSEVVYEGGTQWMNSGAGIVHSERPAKEIAESGGDFEIIQFWVNAPAKNKMDDPTYQPISKADTPFVEGEDKLSKTYVIVGEHDDVKGKIEPYSDLLVLRLDIQAGGSKKIQIPSTYNALIYQLDGESTINTTEKALDKSMMWFNTDGEGIEITAEKDSRIILLSGEPIGEPVATYGPFVMNSNEEINQAVLDYQAGEMGILNEEFED